MFQSRHILYEVQLNIYIFCTVYTITFDIVLVYNDKKKFIQKNKKNECIKLFLLLEIIQKNLCAKSEKIIRVFFNKLSWGKL